MGRQISGPLHIARHILMQDKAWLLFVEIPTKGGNFFRLVRNTRHLAGDGKLWQHAQIDIEAPAEDAEGSLGQLALTVPNVSRLPMAYLELDVGDTGEGELLGQTLTCWLQHESSLATFDQALRWEHLILRGTADELRLRLECGHPAQTQRVPSRLFTRLEFPQLLAQGVVP